MDRLLIDIGNTTLSYCHEPDVELAPSTSVGHGSYQINQLLDEILQSRPFAEILLASVYETGLIEQIQQWCLTNNVVSKVANSQSSSHGLSNGYSDFSQLGVDRWLAMLGIWSKTQSAFFLVSCGTAVTFDLVNDQGNHQGGIIIPGFQLMQSCLKKGTVGINNTDENNGVFWGLAKNTENALANGSLMAISSLIDNLIIHSGMEISQGYISGGDANLINSYRQSPLKIEQNAVLKGLAVAFEDVSQ